MPFKRKTIGRSTLKARKKRSSQTSETNNQRIARLKTNRVHNSQALLSETEQIYIYIMRRFRLFHNIVTSN